MKLTLNLALIFLLLGLIQPTTATTDEAEKRRLQEKILQAKYADNGYAKNRDDIIQKRRRHKQNLRNMVHSLRKKLSDHAYGSITLTPEEKARTEYNMDILQRKVDSMDDDVHDFVSSFLVSHFVSK